MPIFEYTCLQCQHRFEKLQKADDALPDACPVCGSAQIRKELSTFAATNPSPAAGCSGGG